MNKQTSIGPKTNDKMSYFKKFAVIRISSILIRNQVKQGFEKLKQIPKENSRSNNQISSNKDTISSAKSLRQEKQFFVQVSLEKIKLTNKLGSQSLQVMPKDLSFLNKNKKRSSLKEDVQSIKIQNEKNIKEFNSESQLKQQSQKLKQINQIIELQTFGPKLMANQLKKKRESLETKRFNFLIFIPILILILMALTLS